MKATNAIILEVTKEELNILCMAIDTFTERAYARIHDNSYTTTEKHVEQYEQMYLALSKARIDRL